MDKKDVKLVVKILTFLKDSTTSYVVKDMKYIEELLLILKDKYGDVEHD